MGRHKAESLALDIVRKDYKYPYCHHGSILTKIAQALKIDLTTLRGRVLFNHSRVALELKLGRVLMEG